MMINEQKRLIQLSSGPVSVVSCGVLPGHRPVTAGHVQVVSLLHILVPPLKPLRVQLALPISGALEGD